MAPGRGQRKRNTSRKVVSRREYPLTARPIPHPSDPPEIREQLISQRWVRISLTFSTAGLNQVKISAVIGSMFTDADQGRGAFYLHRIRIYGPQITSDASGSAPARITTPSVNVNIPLKPLSTGSTFPFQRFTDQGTSGSARACVAVEMPRFWQDFPLSHENSDTVIVEFPGVITAVTYLLDLLVTISYAPETSAYQVVL